MENENIKKTCLNAQHRSQGAKMVEFGGFDMPLEYAGIVEEHNAVRQHCGVFDVSHMGEFLVSGPEALRFVNHIFTNEHIPYSELENITFSRGAQNVLNFTILGNFVLRSASACSGVGKLSVPNCFMASFSRFL